MINFSLTDEQTSVAEMVRDSVYPDAHLVFDSTKPDGTPKKLLDVSRLQNLGWAYSIALDEGVRTSYEWYVANQALSPATGVLDRLDPKIHPVTVHHFPA